MGRRSCSRKSCRCTWPDVRSLSCLPRFPGRVSDGSLMSSHIICERSRACTRDGMGQVSSGQRSRAKRVLGEAEHAVETGSTASLSDTWKGFCPRDGCARTRSSSLAWRAISCSIVSIIARWSGVREATDLRVAEGWWRVARQAYGIQNSSHSNLNDVFRDGPGRAQISKPYHILTWMRVDEG